MKTWNASKNIVFTVVWASPAPTCRHLGHQKSMPMPTHGRSFKFLLILIAFEGSWGVQGWTHEPPSSSNFRLCPFRGTLEGTGSPKHPHGHHNYLKMNPETDEMTPKSTPRLTKQLHNKLIPEEDNKTTTSDEFDTLMNRGMNRGIV